MQACLSFPHFLCFQLRWMSPCPLSGCNADTRTVRGRRDGQPCDCIPHPGSIPHPAGWRAPQLAGQLWKPVPAGLVVTVTSATGTWAWTAVQESLAWGGTVLVDGSPAGSHSGTVVGHGGTVVVNAPSSVGEGSVRGPGDGGAPGTVVEQRSSRDGGDYLAALRAASAPNQGCVASPSLECHVLQRWPAGGHASGGEVVQLEPTAPFVKAASIGQSAGVGSNVHGVWPRHGNISGNAFSIVGGISMVACAKSGPSPSVLNPTCFADLEVRHSAPLLLQPWHCAQNLGKPTPTWVVFQTCISVAYRQVPPMPRHHTVAHPAWHPPDETATLTVHKVAFAPAVVCTGVLNQDDARQVSGSSQRRSEISRCRQQSQWGHCISCPSHQQCAATSSSSRGASAGRQVSPLAPQRCCCHRLCHNQCKWSAAQFPPALLCRSS